MKPIYSLLLYIQVTNTPEEVSFHSPLQPILKQENQDIIRYDFDNHSDQLVLSYAEKLWNEATFSIIYIAISSKDNLGKCRLFLDKIIENHTKSYFIIDGENLLLDRMMSVYPQNKISKNTYKTEQIEALIEQLLKP